MTKNNKIYSTGTWSSFQACLECSHYLAGGELYYNDFICPYCGYEGVYTIENNKATTNTCHKTIIRRFIRTVPWFKFWGIRGYWEIKDDKK